MAAEFYKVKDLVALFGVSYWTVLRWARLGKMRAFKAPGGKEWMFPKLDVDNFPYEGYKNATEENSEKEPV